MSGLGIISPVLQRRAEDHTALRPGLKPQDYSGEAGQGLPEGVLARLSGLDIISPVLQRRAGS